MVVQIQTLLRHFGIPYITAPMEAEAQCAKLAELNLVDGIITDDSDVFLFGGTTCFKNIFNDAKYAEVYAASDIQRELSLPRHRLIELAYLLGSDYTIGLLGVGPVMALELLANFPGDGGLLRFKEWWAAVQVGKDDTTVETKWKRSFKKRFAGSLDLGAEWPNPLVRDAYFHPQTDESDEPFHWGFPRLSALRTYLHEELSWSISKVDDELTPIVQRIAARGRGAVPRQGTLLPFFDHSAAAGSFAPRRRTTANVSKRLLSVIKEFREAEARAAGEAPQGLGEMLAGVDEADPRGKGKGKGKEKENGAEPKKTRKAPARKRASRSTTAASGAADAGDSGDEAPARKRRKT
jgi:DNA excision repair protein ERCC-5